MNFSSDNFKDLMQDGRYKAAVDLLVQAGSTVWRANAIVAYDLVKEGKLAEALPVMRASIRNADTGSEDYKNLLCNLGECLFYTSDFKRAFSAFRRAEMLGVRHGKIFYFMARSLCQIQNSPKSLEYVEKALGCSSEEVQDILPQILLVKGDCYFETGQNRDAENTYLEVLKCAVPEQNVYRGALSNLAHALIRMGELDRAEAILYEAATRIYEGDPGMLSYYCHFLIEYRGMEPDMMDQAEGILRGTLVKYPGIAVLHALLGDCLDRQKRNTEEVVLSYRAAIRIEPENVDYHCRLGRFYYRNRMYDRALPVFRHIVSERDLMAGMEARELFMIAIEMSSLDEALAARYRRAAQAKQSGKCYYGKFMATPISGQIEPYPAAG